MKTSTTSRTAAAFWMLGICVFWLADLSAQGPPPRVAAPAPAPAAAAAVVAPPDYVIGPEDVLGIVFWREPDMNGDVTVRPDGRVTLPLIGEMRAEGLKPEALRDQIQAAAGKYMAAPNVSVVIRQINSRKVFITGKVTTPGTYPLAGPRNVMQIIALAGGLNEYADAKNITVLRNINGKSVSFKFNYKDVAKGLKLEQNILLQPGDTVVVP
jgi:polysaccharide biosynthesis/export protein